MAVTLRLKRMGTKRKPHFRLVAIDSRKARGGRPIEELGYYDPSKNPPKLSLNKERIQYWLGVGAQSSATVHNILKEEKITKP